MLLSRQLVLKFLEDWRETAPRVAAQFLDQAVHPGNNTEFFVVVVSSWQIRLLKCYPEKI